MLRNYFFCAVCAFAAVAAPARAFELCSIPMRLEANQQYLPYKVYVKPSETGFVAGYGFTLTPGLYNGYGLSTKQIFDWFDVNGCQDELVDWVLTKGLTRLKHNTPASKPAPVPATPDPTPSTPVVTDPPVVLEPEVPQ
jgi:hypothetical protein